MEKNKVFVDTSWLNDCKIISYKEAMKDVEPYELDEKADKELIDFIKEENKKCLESVK